MTDPDKRCGVETNEFNELVLDRLEAIEATMTLLLERENVKDWYSVEELAKALGRAEFTVREWCRQKRIKAQKKGSGRGKYQGWVVSHAELQRIQREGLLPLERA
jgi:Helix-turn-helix domain